MQKDLTHIISHLSAPVFLAEEGFRGRITLHTMDKAVRRDLRQEMAEAMKDEGIKGGCTVRAHGRAQLENAGSIDELLRPFGSKTIVYDPTGSISRGKALLESASGLKRLLGKRLRGLYFAPHSRTIYAVLQRSMFVKNDKVRVDDLREVEQTVGAAFGDTGGIAKAVRIGLSMPGGPVVPLDRASAVVERQRSKKFGIGSIAALLAMCLGIGAAKAAGPAVSKPNMKASVSHFDVDGDNGILEDASVTAPMGERMGLQVDAAAAQSDVDVWGAGVQLFTRDPEKGLLGVTGSFFELDPDEMILAGVEGELYLGQLSLLANAGYQFGEGNLTDTAYGSLDLAWYATDNFMVSVGAEVDEDETIGNASLEFQPGIAAIPGLSVLGRGSVGEDDFNTAMVGVRYYFGADTKSLKARHREDDPRNLIARNLTSGRGARQRHKAALLNGNGSGPASYGA